MSWAFITALRKLLQQSCVHLAEDIMDELATGYTQQFTFCDIMVIYTPSQSLQSSP